MLVLSRHGEYSQAVANDDDGGLTIVERNLKGLTMGIPRERMGDIPYHLQRHTVGVHNSVSSLLRRVAQEVVCYQEHNVPVDK